MNLSRQEREELNALSKEVFNSSGKWQKLLSKGYNELVTEEKEEEVPGENGAEPTKKTVKVAVNYQGATKSNIYVRKYHTVESIRELMLKYKAQLDELKAKMAAEQAEKQKQAQLEELSKNIAKHADGKAV